MAASLAFASLTGCSTSSAGKEPAGQETEAAVNVSLDDVLNKIKRSLRRGLHPQHSHGRPDVKRRVIGLSPELCESYVAEMPMISTFVETFIGVKAKEGKGDDVEKALTGIQRERLVGDTMQYPMNVSKIQASQVVRHGDYVFFVMLGGPDDAAMEQGDEAALKSAEENNKIAIDVIDGFFK